MSCAPITINEALSTIAKSMECLGLSTEDYDLYTEDLEMITDQTAYDPEKVKANISSSALAKYESNLDIKGRECVVVEGCNTNLCCNAKLTTTDNTWPIVGMVIGSLGMLVVFYITYHLYIHRKDLGRRHTGKRLRAAVRKKIGG